MAKWISKSYKFIIPHNYGNSIIIKTIKFNGVLFELIQQVLKIFEIFK